MFVLSFCSIDPQHFGNNSCQRICIAYEEHTYVICMSNKKVYVVKRRNRSQEQTDGPATVDAVESINVLA